MTKEIQLSTVIEEISMGPFGSDIKVDNFIATGIPVLNGSNLSDKKLVEDSFKYISEKKANTLGRANAKRGDIVITHRGTLGQVSYIPENSKYERYIISQSQFRVRFKERINPIYLTYLFHTPYGQKKLLSFKNHVGVPALAQATSNFKLLQLRLHERNEQDKIASVLSALDDKIELNNRINTELEAMAKTIYDYWFVQFDFPDANGKPYKSSGGKMVYNDVLKREVPEGWRAGTLADLGNIIGGSTPSREVEEYFSHDGTAWITPKDLSLNIGSKYITRGELDVSEKGIKAASLTVMPANTILLSSRAPIGYLAISRTEVTTNQGFKSFVTDKGFSTEFVYYAIKNMIPAIENNAVGSTFKEVSGTTLKMLQVCLPDKSIVDKYNEKVKPIFNRQNVAELENQQLSQLRDWLLPMLMNGQVSVADGYQQAAQALRMAAEDAAGYGKKK